jgi:hypothetical protein
VLEVGPKSIAEAGPNLVDNPSSLVDELARQTIHDDKRLTAWQFTEIIDLLNTKKPELSNGLPSRSNRSDSSRSPWAAMILMASSRRSLVS